MEEDRQQTSALRPGGHRAVMRVTTLKSGKDGLKGLIDYYAGLATDQLSRDGANRGRSTTTSTPTSRRGGGGTRGVAPWAWPVTSVPSSWPLCSMPGIPDTADAWGEGSAPISPGLRRHVLGTQVSLPAVGPGPRPKRSARMISDIPARRC